MPAVGKNNWVAHSAACVGSRLFRRGSLQTWRRHRFGHAAGRKQSASAGLDYLRHAWMLNELSPLLAQNTSCGIRHVARRHRRVNDEDQLTVALRQVSSSGRTRSAHGASDSAARSPTYWSTCEREAGANRRLQTTDGQPICTPNEIAKQATTYHKTLSSRPSTTRRRANAYTSGHCKIRLAACMRSGGGLPTTSCRIWQGRQFGLARESASVDKIVAEACMAGYVADRLLALAFAWQRARGL